MRPSEYTTSKTGISPTSRDVRLDDVAVDAEKAEVVDGLRASDGGEVDARDAIAECAVNVGQVLAGGAADLGRGEVRIWREAIDRTRRGSRSDSERAACADTPAAASAGSSSDPSIRADQGGGGRWGSSISVTVIEPRMLWQARGQRGRRVLDLDPPPRRLARRASPGPAHAQCPRAPRNIVDVAGGHDDAAPIGEQLMSRWGLIGRDDEARAGHRLEDGDRHVRPWRDA